MHAETIDAVKLVEAMGGSGPLGDLTNSQSKFIASFRQQLERQESGCAEGDT